MEALLQEHASAIFGLLGASLGGFLSFIAAWAMKNREYSLKIWDRLLERRIKAHENLIAVAIEMRVMVALGGFDPDGEVTRSPQVLISKEEFEHWMIRFVQLTREETTWLTIKAKREVNFVQDYLVTLHTNVASAPSDKYLSVGRIIRQDFIDLSSALEKVAYEYFENEIEKRQLSDLAEWHKYPRQKTETRLSGMLLISKWDSVKEVLAEKDE